MSEFIFISGASSGIGKDACRKLIMAGYNLIVTVRKEKDRIDLLNEFKTQLFCIICDITNSQDLKSCNKEVSSILGDNHLYAVINNAGIAIPGPLHLISDEKFFKQLDVNLISTRKLTNILIPYLKPASQSKNSKILFISSVSGIFASPFNGSYCISKHALECLVDIYRRELKYIGIDVISILPGPIKTKIWQKVTGEFDNYKDSFFQSIAKKADDIIKESQRTALDVNIVSNTILNILKSNNPKTRYLIHRRPHIIKLLAYYTPTKWLDKLIWKNLNKSDGKTYRPV